MDRADALARFGDSQVARLATVRPDGAPHVVPVTFVLVDDTVVTAIDHKPKSTTDLQRLRNIEAEPRVSLLVDHFDEDWDRLWWVRVDGTAVIADQATAPWLARLSAKYPQYRDRPPEGPAVAVSVTAVRWWSPGGRGSGPG